MEVTLRLVVYSPTGTHTLMLPLPDGEEEHVAHFRLAPRFTVWKAATGFILSTELKDSRRHHGHDGDARRNDVRLATCLPRSRTRTIFAYGP